MRVVGRFLAIFPVMLALALVQGAQAQVPSASPFPTPLTSAKPRSADPAPTPVKPSRSRTSKPKEEPGAAVTQPDANTGRIAPVPMEAFAAEADPQPASQAVKGKPEEPSACQLRVADRIAVIEPLPALAGPGDCGATDVVRLEAIIQSDKSRVTLSPPATMRCTMAEALANWVREDLTATAAQLGSAPHMLDNYASYDCRGRNRVAGARISQHGLANAIDVRGVHLANGRFASFTDRKLDRGFREAVRKSICERFTTVLGPGSDGHHEDHIHMDLAERRGGYRLCQWNVLDPAGEVPLPRPRPKEAP
jgi:hypothetical protein